MLDATRAPALLYAARRWPLGPLRFLPPLAQGLGYDGADAPDVAGTAAVLSAAANVAESLVAVPSK